MSTCVSSHGEYSSHVPDGDFNCTRCWALDEDGLRAEVTRLTAENTRPRAVAAWADTAIDVLRQDTDSDLDEWFISRGIAAVRAWREGE